MQTITGSISSNRIAFTVDQMLSRGCKKKLSKSHNSLDMRFLKITEKIKLPGKKHDMELTLLFAEDSVFFTTGSVVIKR